MLGAMALAWLDAQQAWIDTFETFLLVGGATTFFWVGGLLDGSLLLQKKSDPLRGDAIQVRASIVMLCLSTIAAVVCGLFCGLAYEGLEMDTILYFGIYWGMETCSNIVPYHYIAHGRTRQLWAFGLASSVAYCLAISLPLWLGWGLGGMLVALVAVGVAKFGWTLLTINAIPKSVTRHAGIGQELWRISHPLVLATLLSQSAVYIDGFLVQKFFPGEFVDFRYGAKEFPLVLLLANSMSIVRAGEISAGLRDQQVGAALQDLRSGSSRLIWSMVPLSIVLMVTSGPLFEVFFANRFPMAMPVFDIFLLLAIPRLMFPQSVVRGYQQTWMMSVSAGVELVLNVGLSLLLMQWYGIAGIAAGTVIAFVVEKAILLGYAQFKLGVSWQRYASVPLWLGGSLLLLLVWLGKYVFWPMLA